MLISELGHWHLQSLLNYFLGFGLLALEKAECFEDNSFSSLLNFYGGKYFKSALQAFFVFFWKSLEK